MLRRRSRIQCTCNASSLYKTQSIQSINQSISQSIDRSTDRSIDRSINQSINQLIHRSINQSINQSISVCVYVRYIYYFVCIYTIFSGKLCWIWTRDEQVDAPDRWITEVYPTCFLVSDCLLGEFLTVHFSLPHCQQRTFTRHIACEYP